MKLVLGLHLITSGAMISQAYEQRNLKQLRVINLIFFYTINLLANQS